MGLLAMSRAAHDIDTTNTIAAGNRVRGQEEVDGVGDGLFLATFAELELDRDALLKVDGEVLGLVGGSHRVLGQLPHVGWGSSVGVLQNAGLV